nr:MAG TPA: hypothetical protein [Bacteriophage sp.]
MNRFLIFHVQQKFLYIIKLGNLELLLDRICLR